MMPVAKPARRMSKAEARMEALQVLATGRVPEAAALGQAVATRARPARKPSAAQIRVLARMVQDGWKLYVFAWGQCLLPDASSIRSSGIVNLRTFRALRAEGWIEPEMAGAAHIWRVSDAGRRAAE